MDATNQKNLARALVALMVGSVFVTAIAPTAEATHLGPGEDIVIDVRAPAQTISVEGVGNFSQISVPTSPAGFKIRHSTGYNINFTNIGTALGTGYGYAGSATQVELVNGSQVVATANLGQGPDATSKAANFIITTTMFPGPGTYVLRVSGGGNNIAAIFVYPHETMTVSVARSDGSPLTWSPTAQTVVRVTTSEANTDVTDCDPTKYQHLNSLGCIGFLLAPNKTDASSQFNFVSTLPMGVGTWKVFAYKNNTGSGAQTVNGRPIPWSITNTTVTVVGQGLNLATGPAASAFVGFQNVVNYRPVYPATGNPVFKGPFPVSDLTALSRINFSITTPGNVLITWNDTVNNWGMNTGSTVNVPTAACRNLTTGTTGCTAGQAAPTAVVPGLTINGATGDISVTPADEPAGTTLSNVWLTGTYTFNLQLEAASPPDSVGALDNFSPPEVAHSWTLNPATPAAVNVEMHTGTTVDVPVANPAPGATSPVSAAQGTVSFWARIRGLTTTEFPLSAPCGAVAPAACTTGWERDTNFVDNLTLRGDVMPGWFATYNTSTGEAGFRLTPTQNGTVFLDINWKNVTTTVPVPVARGAKMTVDVQNITVDQTATVTVNIKNALGGNVENANVYIFPRQTIADMTTALAAQSAASGFTGSTIVFGTGGPNAGQGGNYVFSVKPAAVQDLLVYAVVGQSPNVNYTYQPLTVLPATNLSVVVNNTQTMAGWRTPLFVNVTDPGVGTGLTTTDANVKVYFLTETQRANLLNNGTTALFTTGTIPVANTTANGFANGTFLNVTLDYGTYWVYACQHPSASITDCRTAQRDNRGNLPTFRVHAWNATFTPPQIANNPDIQGATSIHVRVTDWNGSAAPPGNLRVKNNGTLVSSGPSTSVQIVNGQANITLTGANTGIGEIEWEFNPTESGTDDPMFGKTNGTLSVIPGNLTFQPSRVPILQSTLVTIRLTNFTGSGLAGREIRLCSVSLNANFPTTFPTNLVTPTDVRTNCPTLASTEADGSAGIVVTPTSLNPIGIYINNSYTGRTLPVTAGTLVVTVNPTSPVLGGNATVTVTQPGGTLSVGARILVTRDGATALDATADGNGQARLTNLAAGNYTVTGIRSGFDNGTASFTIGPGQTVDTGARFNLSNLVVPATISVGSPAAVRVTVTNTGNASGTATAVLLVNNIQRGSESVTLAAGQNQTVEYTFTPSVAGTYAIIVRIGEVTLGPQNIVVGTPPTGTPPTGTPPTGTPPTGTPPTSTPPTGTPPVTTTTRVTATPATTTPETTPTVPGFEVVALFAALGAALIVLGRRRN